MSKHLKNVVVKGELKTRMRITVFFGKIDNIQDFESVPKINFYVTPFYRILLKICENVLEYYILLTVRKDRFYLNNQNVKLICLISR